MAKEYDYYIIVRERQSFPNPRALAELKRYDSITYKHVSLINDMFTGKQLPHHLQETAFVNKEHIANALVHINGGSIIVLPYNPTAIHFSYQGLLSTDTRFSNGGFFSQCEFYNHQTGLSVVDTRPFPVLLVQGPKIEEVELTGGILNGKNTVFAKDLLHALAASSRGYNTIKTSSGIRVTQEMIDKQITAVNSGFYEPLSEDFDDFGGTAKGTY